MNSDSAIFCFGEENMNSYEENEKRKDGAKIQFCTIFALCVKMAQDYLHKIRLALSIKRKVLHCAATKTTLVLATAVDDWLENLFVLAPVQAFAMYNSTIISDSDSTISYQV
jgi:hypothetical protein